jgi:hypothetical protein
MTVTHGTNAMNLTNSKEIVLDIRRPGRRFKIVSRIFLENQAAHKSSSLISWSVCFTFYKSFRHPEAPFTDHKFRMEF